jgi:hypothetical protein
MLANRLLLRSIGWFLVASLHGARLDHIQCDSSNLMGTHFLQTLEALGRLARASKDCSSRWRQGEMICKSALIFSFLALLNL